MTAATRQAETPTVPALVREVLQAPDESGVRLVRALCAFGTFEDYLEGLGVSRMALKEPRAPSGT